jgi:hypothetical protein
MNLLRRPSPSLVIALLALFVSLGGVSYGFATGSIDSREIKNNTIRTRDIRNSEVRGRDIRNSTIRGPDVALNTLTGLDVNESKLGKVPSAASADTAAVAGTATVGLSPLAYARVDSSGDVVEKDSRGVTDGNVLSGGSGRYCFVGLSFGFRSAQVTVGYSGGNLDRLAQVGKGDPEGDCGSGNQLEVATSNGSGFAPAGFYVWFYN